MSSSPSGDFDRKVEAARRSVLLDLVRTRQSFARIHRTHNNRELDFSDRPYLLELLNERDLFGEDVQKCVKCGYTEMMILTQLAAAAVGLDVMVTLPADPLVTRYVHNRIDRPLSYVPEYSALLAEATGEIDNVHFKTFGRGTLNFVSTEAGKTRDKAGAFRETPVDCLVIEELDESDQERLKKAYGRLTDSDYKVIYRIANPTHPGSGISVFYEAGTKRKWHVKCRSCGDAQPLDWFVNLVKTIRDGEGQVVDYELLDKGWTPAVPGETGGRDVRLYCRTCGAELDRLEADPEYAFWVDTNPGAPRRSRHFNQLCLPARSIGEMWLQFRAARDDPASTEVFYNEVLGLTYTSAGSKLTPEILDECKGKYACPDAADFCAAGLDVGTMLDLRIDRCPGGRRTELVFADKLRTFAEVENLLDRYGVRIVVVDAKPEVRKTAEFQRALNDKAGYPRVWRCDWLPPDSLRGVVYDEDAGLVKTDRTWALDLDQESYVKGWRGLPRDAAGLIEGELYEELCAIERVAKKLPSGEVRYVWTKGKDHQRLASCYCRIAEQIGGMLLPRVEIEKTLFVEEVPADAEEGVLYL